MLTIQDLVRANVKRAETDFEHPLHSWSLLEWAGACAGEIGEAANVSKKLLRREMGMTRFNKPGETDENLREALGNEIADAIHYAMLWSAAAGIDIEQALIRKFNAVSDRNGSQIFLLEDD